MLAAGRRDFGDGLQSADFTVIENVERNLLVAKAPVTKVAGRCSTSPAVKHPAVATRSE